MLQEALVNQIGKHQEGDNLLLKAIACIVMWGMGKKKKREEPLTLESAISETLSRRATGSPGGNKGVIPYVS